MPAAERSRSRETSFVSAGEYLRGRATSEGAWRGSHVPDPRSFVPGPVHASFVNQGRDGSSSSSTTRDMSFVSASFGSVQLQISQLTQCITQLNSVVTPIALETFKEKPTKTAQEASRLLPKPLYQTLHKEELCLRDYFDKYTRAKQRLAELRERPEELHPLAQQILRTKYQISKEELRTQIGSTSPSKWRRC